MNHIRDAIYDLTGGKRFVLVVMSYREKQDYIFAIIKRIVEAQGRVCIRADQVPGAGFALLEKVHQLIQRAELIIAETTDPDPGSPSPNVYYEIGYAVALGKKPILLRNSDAGELPVDLRGLEVISYKDRMDAQKELEQRLRDDVTSRLATDLPVLRDMLLGADSNASFIITQPKRPREESLPRKRIATFGDRLGILGLLRAFGAILDPSSTVELVSPRHSAEDLLSKDVNLYFIGSQKVTAAVGEVLGKVQEGRQPRWSLVGDPDWQPELDTEKEEDRPLTLVRNDGHAPTESLKAMRDTPSQGTPWIWTEDYGLIVRAPHPGHPRRVVFIMAGLHSLGTGAACLAATQPEMLQEIREKLNNCVRRRGGPDNGLHDETKNGVLEDKGRAFWVLVKGKIWGPDYLLTEKGISIEDVGVYE